MAVEQAIGRDRHSKAPRQPRGYGITPGPPVQQRAAPWRIQWLPRRQDVRGMGTTRHHCPDRSRACRQPLFGWTQLSMWMPGLAFVDP